MVSALETNQQETLQPKVEKPEETPKPQKNKLKIILIALFLIIIIAALVALGFFYYRSRQDNKRLNEEIARLSQQAPAETTTPGTPTPPPSNGKPTNDKDIEIALLKEEVADLNATIKRYENKLNEALTYSGAFKYLVDTIARHGGLNGWTDQDYKDSLEKAKATGDQEFVKAVEDGWNNPNGLSQEARLAIILAQIQDGIHQALREALYP